MKLMIDISKNDFKSLKKLADYAGTTPGRIVEALFSGLEHQPLGNPLDETWEEIIEHVRERDGNTPRLDQIERYMKARAAWHVEAVKDWQRHRDEMLLQKDFDLMRLHFRSLKAWLRLVNEREIKPPGRVKVPLIEALSV